MNKKTNKDRSLQCNRCKLYFDVEKNNMYAIGMKYGVVCLDCWTKTMQQLVEEQVKTKNEPERNFNLGGYDPNIYK